MTPARALYEYTAAGELGPSVPWEELSAASRDFYAGLYAAALSASPELASLRRRLAAVEELAKQTVGERAMIGSGLCHPTGAAILAGRILREVGRPEE